MKPFDTIIVGDLVADIIMPVTSLPLMPNEHDWADGLFTELGGACTTVVAARRLGLSVAALGYVGDDSYGHQVLGMLQDEGVDISQSLALENRQTILCVVVTDKAGQHVFLGIKDHQPPEKCPAPWSAFLEQGRSLYTDGYALRDLLEPESVIELIQHGRSLGLPIFFDPGPSIEYIDPATLSRVLAEVNVMLLTQEEAEFLVDGLASDALAAKLREWGPEVVVLKAGRDGCYVAADGVTVHHPGFAVEVIDTVGAGDSFTAAFIAGTLRGGDWMECAALANAMGAAVVSTQGAGRCVPGVTRLAEILGDDPARRLLRPQ